MERWQIGTFILILLLLSGLAIVMSEVASPTGNGKEVNATCAVMQYATRENASGAFQCGSASNTNYLTTQTAVSTEASTNCPNNQFAQNESLSGAFQCKIGISYQPYTFLVYKNGSNYFAINATEIITYGGPSNLGGATGTDAASVIGHAINSTASSSTHGGEVFLKTAVYLLTGTLDLYEGVWLDGENIGWSSGQSGAVLQTNGNFPALNFISNKFGASQVLFGRLSNVLLQGTNLIADTLNFGIFNANSTAFDFYVDHVAITLFYVGVNSTSGAKLRIGDSTIEGNLKYGVWSNTAYELDMANIYLRSNGLSNSGFAARITNPTNFQIINSQIILNNAGIILTSTTTATIYNYIVSHNFFDGNTGSKGFNFNLELAGTNAVVNNNVFFNESTASSPAQDILLAKSGSVVPSGVINANIFTLHSATTIISYPVQASTFITNNQGYNSIGVITNFISTSGGNFIYPAGTTSTLAASTTYTISIAPVLILVQAIGLSTISINGGSSITPTIGETYYLYPSQTINFGAFGLTPPTLQVIFS